MILHFLQITPAQGKSQPYSFQQVTKRIGFHVNSDKTEFMYFTQDGAISLNGKPLKL